MAASALKPVMLDATLFEHTGHYIVAVLQLDEAVTSSVVCHNGRSYVFDPRHAFSYGNSVAYVELIGALTLAVPMSSLRKESC